MFTNITIKGHISAQNSLHKMAKNHQKRNVAYIKPEDPKFIRMLKEQAGYSDANPKFDDLENEPEDFVEDQDSEKPQVVVLMAGDLTAEEAELEERKIQKEHEEAKADLTQRVIFKSSKSKESDSDRKRTHETDVKKVVNKKSKETSRPVLSFQVEDEEEAE